MINWISSNRITLTDLDRYHNDHHSYHLSLYEQMLDTPTEETTQIRAVDDWVPWLAGLLQLIAAVGWVGAWFAGVFALTGLENIFPQKNWQYWFEFGYIAVNYFAAVFGWPLSLVVAWTSYFRSGKANRKKLLLFTGLPYLHVLLLFASLLVFALLEQYMDLGL